MKRTAALMGAVLAISFSAFAGISVASAAEDGDSAITSQPADPAGTEAVEDPAPVDPAPAQPEPTEPAPIDPAPAEPQTTPLRPETPSTPAITPPAVPVDVKPVERPANTTPHTVSKAQVKREAAPANTFAPNSSATWQRSATTQTTQPATNSNSDQLAQTGSTSVAVVGTAAGLLALGSAALLYSRKVRS